MAFSGTQITTFVPPRGFDLISNLPPSMRERSRILVIPRPRPGSQSVVISKPQPVSEIASWMPPAIPFRQTFAERLPLCFDTLVRHSWAIRNTEIAMRCGISCRSLGVESGSSRENRGEGAEVEDQQSTLRRNGCNSCPSSTACWSTIAPPWCANSIFARRSSSIGSPKPIPVLCKGCLGTECTACPGTRQFKAQAFLRFFRSKRTPIFAATRFLRPFDQSLPRRTHSFSLSLMV